MTKENKEVFIDIQGSDKADLKQNRLMTFGIFQGSKVRIIKDDKINKMMILGVGQKRIALRKEELEGVKFIAAND